MSGQDLHVLAQEFEQCQATFRSRGASIAALAGQLRSDGSSLGSKDVGGDGCAQLAQQVSGLATALEQVGDAGCAGIAAGIQKVLDKFQEVDRAQAANAKLVVTRTR
jgi:hypothetical protein